MQFAHKKHTNETLSEVKRKLKKKKRENKKMNE